MWTDVWWRKILMSYTFSGMMFMEEFLTHHMKTRKIFEKRGDSNVSRNKTHQEIPLFNVCRSFKFITFLSLHCWEYGWIRWPALTECWDWDTTSNTFPTFSGTHRRARSMWVISFVVDFRLLFYRDLWLISGTPFPIFLAATAWSFSKLTVNSRLYFRFIGRGEIRDLHH